MRFVPILVQALASCLAVHGTHLTPREFSQKVVTSFSEVTQAFTSISNRITRARQMILSSSSFRECSSFLTQLNVQITVVVQSIETGCDCEVDDDGSAVVETHLTYWFTEITTICRYIQNRYASYVYRAQTIFGQISGHLQAAIGTAYVAGVQVGNIVQNVIRRNNINSKLLDNFNVRTTEFVQIPKAVEARTGIFANSQPAGRHGLTPAARKHLIPPIGLPHPSPVLVPSKPGKKVPPIAENPDWAPGPHDRTHPSPVPVPSKPGKKVPPIADNRDWPPGPYDRTHSSPVPVVPFKPGKVPPITEKPDWAPGHYDRIKPTPGPRQPEQPWNSMPILTPGKKPHHHYSKS